jgi:septum formation protein
MITARPGSAIFRTREPLILASASPRRRDLLEALGVTFDVVPSGIDEDVSPGESPGEQVVRWASEKAHAVSLLLPGRWVLAADTVVVLDGAVLGKPLNPGDAVEMLQRLSGKAHDVLTGMCLMHRNPDVLRVRSVRTEVVFKDFTQEEIHAYVRTGEPLDKAGAYGIQGMGAFLVRFIRGSYTNVVGLPLCETVEWLLEARVIAAAGDQALNPTHKDEFLCSPQ